MISEEKTIETEDGTKLRAQVVENGSPVWIIVTHGLGEHGSRHSHFFKHFSQYFNICLYDLRGHGSSDGEKANIGSFTDYINDLESIVSYLREQYGMQRHILFGHSMGGLIVSSYLQNRAKAPVYPEKVFLSSPAVAAAGVMGNFFKSAPLKFNKLLASVPLSVKIQGILDLEKLSHDPRVYKDYIQDPLNRIKIHTHLLFEILAGSRKVFSRPLRAQCDLYVAIGSEDELVNAPACIDYFQKTEKQAKLEIFEGAWHEMHNEVERYRAPYLKYLESCLMDSIYT